MVFQEFKANFGQKIRGKGSDTNGEFTIKGKKVKEEGQIKFKKSYESYEVLYEGQLNENEITG